MRQETTICNKLIKFASDLQPINKAQLVTLLAGGSGRSARIARWVAHAILTKSMTVSAVSIKNQHLLPSELICAQVKYNDLPPLISLLELALSPQMAGPDSETRTRGVFELHEDTDFVDFAFHVRILAVAISNVEGYVLEEARETAAVTPKSPGKPSADKPDTLLTIVHHAIENLHSRIGTCLRFKCMSCIDYLI